jgi:hypothetical protein
MEKEAANELHRIEGHGALPVAVSVVPPPKPDVAVLEGDQSRLWRDLEFGQ